jgi:hypothetical protein
MHTVWSAVECDVRYVLGKRDMADQFAMHETITAPIFRLKYHYYSEIT